MKAIARRLRSWNAGLARVLIMALLAAPLAGVVPLTGAVPSAEAAEVGDTTTYSFPAVISSTSESWKVVQTIPSGMRLTATSFQMINNQVSSAANGEKIVIQFHVPVSGKYDLGLNGWKNAAGGKVDIQIDDQVVAPDYSFYSASATSPQTDTIASELLLSKGTHTLTFEAKEPVKLASNGRYYLYLYLNDFRLQLKEMKLELDHVALSTAKTRLNVGESIHATVSATINDGQPADMSAAEISFSSSDDEVITILSAGTEALVTAVGIGQAYLTAAVTMDGVTVTDTVRFIVGEPIRYDFKQSVNSKLEDTGWEITERNVPDGPTIVRNQEYGIQIQAQAVGQYVAFNILVPETGFYQVHLNGAGAGSGGIASILIDGVEAGEYNFHSAVYMKEKGQVGMRTLMLSEGIHNLTFMVKARAGHFHMYPGELELIQVQRMPELVSVSLEASKQELMVGQTAQLTLNGVLGDGYTYNLQKVQSAASRIQSLDETVAVVDDSGKITALKPGLAVIEAEVSMGGVSKQVSMNLTVNDKVLGIVEVAANQTSLTPGKTAQLTIVGKLADGTPVDLSDASVVYISEQPNIAAVSSEGVVTAAAVGTATVSADVTLGNTTVRGSLAIEVTAPALESISVKMSETQLFVGDHRKIYVEGSLNDGGKADLSQAGMTYTSSNPQVAAAANGAVDVLQPGSATITVSVTLGTVTMTSSIAITANELTSSKTRSTYYTAEKTAATRENVNLYDWASRQRDSVVAAADPYVALGYETLWSLVPPQSIPRGYAVNQTKGSPVTGLEINKYGNYPYTADPLNEPWKITDPSSGYKFPTNDFGAYYESGLNENGIFDPDLADRSLLVNTLYPEKGPTWGVDDGYGWIDENGDKYTFIAYYAHWHIWHGGVINQAIRSLRDAYVLTGDVKYARAGIVLLDRIADVYPDMDTSVYKREDGYLNSDGLTGLGKIVGSIWETSLVREYLSAYDAFFPAMDDPEVIAFLSSKADQYDLGVKKKSATGIRRNIEDGIVRQIYPNVKNAKIRGNNGMHQATLAMAAVVLDTMPETKEWLDFNFQTGGFISGQKKVTGGNILTTLVNDVDRDGAGNEASPEYNQYWLGTYQAVADILDGYDTYPVADLYQNVKFRKMFSAKHPLMLSDIYTALIGDGGKTGAPISYLNQAQYVRAFEKFGDPIYAQLVYYLNNNRTDGIHSDMSTRNPEAIAERIAQVIAEHGPLKLDSGMLSGYGFAALRDGDNTLRFSGINYDFSSLEVTEATADYQLFTNSGTIQFNADSTGHRLAFAFDVPRTDRYEVNLKPFRAMSYGIYTVKLDGVPVKTLDFSGSSGAGSKLEVIADMQLEEGRHIISFEGVGKNANATNYKMGVMQLQLFDEAAKVVKNDPNNANTMRDVWVYFGRNTGHGHKDTLNLGMHAFGLDLMPELGYPEFADSNPKRYEWENHTISHNTVLVDRSKQANQVVGQPVLFDDTERVKLIEVAAADSVYPQTDLYQRTTAMIQVDAVNSYAVDFFRVKGGNDHHYSFHSAEGTVTTDGLNMVPQPTGTYAGPNVNYGVRVDSVAGSGYMGSGFHYLKNVARDTAPADSFSVDWNVRDTWDIYGNGAKAPTDVHLKLTMLNEVDSVALADGVPPTNKAGNPETLRYMIAHRSGTNLESNFTSVIEPYKGNRFVESIQAVPVTSGGVEVTNELEVKAVKVVLKNGRTDYIVSSINPDKTYHIDNKLVFQGALGVYSEQDGQQAYAYVQEGVMMGLADSPMISGASAKVTGTVVDFTKTLSIDNEIIVSAGLNGMQASDLAGRTIYVQNDGIRNATYKIQSADDLGNGLIKLDIGDITTIRSYKDENDFSKGFIYDLAAGASFRIPLSVQAEHIETYAAVAGELKQGWYAEDVTVMLGVYGNVSNVVRTEFSLNGGDDWAAYEEPIPMTEDGQHMMLYRSVTGFGTVEPAKSLLVQIDKQAPTAAVYANGAVLENGARFVTADPITLQVIAEDSLSGVAEVTVLVDGGSYVQGTPIDWAGQPGLHQIRVSVSDVAGNKHEAVYDIELYVTVESLRQQLGEYAAQGEVNGPMTSQLVNAVEQAKHHYDMGRQGEAVKHLQDLLKHLNNEALQEHVNAEAKAALQADVSALIADWSK